MASSSPALCQHAQCDAFQFTVCRHCQLFLCIRHLAEHQQQFPSDFQRLLDDARRQQAQLSTIDTKTSDTRVKCIPTLDNDINAYRQAHAYVQTKPSSMLIHSSMNASSSQKFFDLRSNIVRLPSTSAFIPAMMKIGSLSDESETTINMNSIQYDDESLYAAAFGGRQIEYIDILECTHSSRIDSTATLLSTTEISKHTG
jgi:hypothetical protein